MRNTEIDIRVRANYKENFFVLTHKTSSKTSRKYKTPVMTQQEFDLAFHFTARDWLEEIRQGNCTMI